MKKLAAAKKPKLVAPKPKPVSRIAKPKLVAAKPAPRTAKPKKPGAPHARKPAASPRPVTLADLDLSIIAHDAGSITIGGFARPEIVGRFGDAVVLSCANLGVSAVLELATPPVLRPLAHEYVQACGVGRDGRLVAQLGLWKNRFVRVFPPSLDLRAAHDLPVKPVLEFAGVGFAGGRVVAIPGHLGTHRRSFTRHAQLPYLEVDGALVAAAGLGADPVGHAEELSGVVPCADGRDVIVWAGRMFERTGDALARTIGFDLERNHNNTGLTWAIHGRGFFTISRQKLVEVVPGEPAARVHAANDYFAWVRPGPRDTLLLGAVHDTAAQSRLWLYEPARLQLTPISSPAGTDPTTAFYSPGRGAIGALATANQGTAGWTIVLATA